MNKLRASVLLLWIVGLTTLLIAGRYSLFIRAQLWPMLLATTLMFVALLIALKTRWGRSVRSISPAAALQAAMLMLPLVYMVSTATGSAASGLNSFALQKRSLGMDAGSQARASDTAASGAVDPNAELSLSYVSRHAKRLAGTDVLTMGRVYKDPSIPPDEVMIFRFVVVCCAADATPAQLLVRTPDAAKLQSDSWIRVKGTVSQVDVNGGKMPCIIAANVESVEAPADPYLGPQ